VTDRKAAPPPGSLGGLVALGALSALWALFLWAELLLARAGGSPFCPLGEAGQCTALWDGAFASLVHRYSGVPIAGWGLAWGLAATALPLFALVRAAEGRALPSLVTAIRLTAGLGAVAVFVFLAVSVAAGTLCGGCIGTYLFVAGYAGIALVGWKPLGLPEPRQGAAVALGAHALALLVLVYPGLRTPREAGEAGREALAKAAAASSPGTSDAARDKALEDFVASLDPSLKQTLSDALGLYERGPAFPAPPPRFVVGPAEAPVRITEFTDVLCDHCAQLHESLQQLARLAPPGSFNVEPRQFPLDGECNPAVQRRELPVRCAAAKAQICMETTPHATEFTGALFAKQKSLGVEDVYAIGSRYVAREALEACVASPQTQARLQDDIAFALRYEPEGTPLVVVNGRKAVAFPAFLYALVLTRGASNHPAFDRLPPANPNAHLH
jgi:serine/threonine-protein kinase